VDRQAIGSAVSARDAEMYKGKKDAQDAHEAIRPTDASRTPESIARYLTEEQLKLYRLIWQRFVASQMTPAVFDVTTAKIAAVSAKTGKTYDFRVSGSVVRFDGFLKVYEETGEKKDEDDEAANKLPNLDNVKKLELEKLLDPSSTLRSRLRATTRLRWSRSLRSGASGGHRPTRRSSTPFRIANT
jgi:DNA topoisomerase-1